MTTPLLLRVAKRIRMTDHCWEWTGNVMYLGYGQIKVNDRNEMAHRAVYELLVGSIPEGMTLDHLCRNRGCVNPDHLEPVTHRENVLRGTGPTAENARKTHCVNGHPFEGHNLIERPDGSRRCRTCNNVRYYQYKKRKRALTERG